MLDDPRINAAFTTLDLYHQVLVMAAYLYRQRRLIEAFDQLYAEQATGLFIQALHGALLLDDGQVLQRLRQQVEQCIPDTEVYPAQEGAYAQNLLIALMYFLDFVQTQDPAGLERSLAMQLENIDLLHYEQDEHYDADQALEQERQVLLALMAAVEKRPGKRCRDVQCLADLSQPYSL